MQTIYGFIKSTFRRRENENNFIEYPNHIQTCYIEYANICYVCECYVMCFHFNCGSIQWLIERVRKVATTITKHIPIFFLLNFVFFVVVVVVVGFRILVFCRKSTPEATDKIKHNRTLDLCCYYYDVEVYTYLYVAENITIDFMVKL